MYFWYTQRTLLKLNCTICQYCCANKNIKRYSSWMSLLLYWDISLCSDNVCGVMLCIQLFSISFYLFNYILVYLFICFCFDYSTITQSECWLSEEKRCGQNSEYRQTPSSHSICNVSYHGCTGTSRGTVRPGIQVIQTRPKYMRHTRLQGPTVNKHKT